MKIKDKVKKLKNKKIIIKQKYTCRNKQNEWREFQSLQVNIHLF